MFLGLDIGTSGVKAVLIDAGGAIVAQAQAPLKVSRPAPLQSEQDPEDWWSASGSAVRALPAKLRSGVKAVGLSGQMHGATLLGTDDRPLRPAILWNDGRSHAECAELERAEPRSREITANLAMPGFTAPKLLWVRRHEPEVFGKVAKVLLPKDYVRLRMTGTHAGDMSDAAGTLWLDVAKRRWSAEMLAASGLDVSHMPDLFEGPEVTGTLRAEVAADWGMAAVPVVAGGGDNAAGAVGVGVVAPGSAFLSLGTSGVLFLAGEAVHASPETGVHAFCHALPGRWHQMSVMLSAASCVDWAARLTRLSAAEDPGALAAQRARLDGPEVFLPYLSGERTPHNDPHARGVLFGIDHDSDIAAIMQAVFEGVAFAFADGLDALMVAGGQPEEITVIGGGSRSRYWGRILSAALERPLVYRKGSEVGPALGAARLARLGTTGEALEAVCAAPPVDFTVEPDEEDIEELSPKRERFRALYTALKPAFAEGSH